MEDDGRSILGFSFSLEIWKIYIYIFNRRAAKNQKTRFEQNRQKGPWVPQALVVAFALKKLNPQVLDGHLNVWTQFDAVCM